MPWAELNGIRTYYELEGEGPALVFCHSTGANHLAWWQQVPYFRDRYRCLTYDLRGHGLSSEVPDGPANAAFADDLRALLDFLGIERAAFVYQSGGGQAGLRFAVAYPWRVWAQVLVNSGSGVTSDILNEKLRVYRSEHPDIRPETHAYTPEQRARRPDIAYLYDALVRLNPEREARPPALPEERYQATPEKLAKLQIPTLMVVGAKDIVAPLEVFRWVASLIPGSRYVELPHCGSLAYFEDAPAFNQVVDDFLASVRPTLA